MLGPQWCLNSAFRDWVLEEAGVVNQSPATQSLVGQSKELTTDAKGQWKVIDKFLGVDDVSMPAGVQNDLGGDVGNHTRDLTERQGEWSVLGRCGR